MLRVICDVGSTNRPDKAVFIHLKLVTNVSSIFLYVPISLDKLFFDN